MTRIPARCNRRACQARRNLSKRPEMYVRPPVCHVAGCSGLMYVDEYRLRRGEHDRAPLCYDDCMFSARVKWPTADKPHRYDSAGCKHYDEWQLRSAARASKHSPKFNRCDDETAPF